MQTIEAAVLVPLGLGLVTLLLMLTFFLHDQTVLEAEYAEAMLGWQQNMDSLKEEGEKSGEEIGRRTLITQVEVTERSFGSLIGGIKTEETRKIFQRGMSLLSTGRVDEERNREITWVKIDAFWLKRIWRASEFG
ncbi:MAG: hypothetical protein IJN46_10455 [Lachnospiraceae bacterium]|nr:hypothetical protein [Lachnospiraceae bacterium]